MLRVNQVRVVIHSSFSNSRRFFPFSASPLLEYFTMQNLDSLENLLIIVNNFDLNKIEIVNIIVTEWTQVDSRT